MWKFLKSSKDDSVDDSIQFITTPGEFGGTCVNDQPAARRKWWFSLSTVPSHFYSGYNLQTCNLLFSFRLKLSSLIPLCWSFPRKLSKSNCCDLARGSSHPFQFRIQFYQFVGGSSIRVLVRGNHLVPKSRFTCVTITWSRLPESVLTFDIPCLFCYSKRIFCFRRQERWRKPWAPVTQIQLRLYRPCSHHRTG